VSVTVERCRVPLSRFLSRELSDWRGLPSHCRERDLEALFPLRPGEGATRLGVDLVSYRFRVLEWPGLLEPVHLLFASDILRMLRTGLWSTDRSECDRLLGELGQPDSRVDLAFGVTWIPDGDWVYASRGLTLSVIPDTGLIAGVEAYPPGTLQSYLRSFHNTSPAREFPAP